MAEETEDVVGSEELNDEVVESPEEEVSDEQEEETTQSSEEGDNSSEASEEGEEEAVTVDSRSPSWKQVNEKYPKFFKDFPALRNSFFREKEYSKVFASVDEAKDALERLDEFSNIQNALTSGEEKDLTSMMENFDKKTVSSLGNNFLPALYDVNKEAYYEAIKPVLANFCRSLFDAGSKDPNESSGNNMKNAARVAAAHFFGDQKIATGEKTVPREESQKDSKLDQERREFHAERYTSLLNDVVTSSNSALESFISNGLDPRGVMTDAMKEMIVERITKEVNSTLKSDRSYMSRINSLWKKAEMDGFSSSHKSKILQAYLERAKEIVPSIRSKIRSAALGTKTQKAEGDSETNRGGRKEPLNTTGGGSRKVNGAIDPKKINWKKTSDIDIMNGRITYK